MKQLLIICGLTGTGKTALGLELAQKFNGELVSADSRQVYKGMDIGTGKDLPRNVKCQMSNVKCQVEDKEFLLNHYLINGVRLWMYDVVEPSEEFTAYHYQVLARSVIKDIWKRGKLPIIVGGSGMYTDALLGKIDLPRAGGDKKLREELNSWPLDKLQKEIKMNMPFVWERMNSSDRQNPRRLIRKLEIGNNSVRRDLAVLQGLSLQKTADILEIGLMAELPELYKRIDARVDARVRAGVTTEIGGLLKKDYKWEDPGMNALGYKEWRFLFNNQDPRTKNQELNKEIIQRWKWDEHGYARRQMTWFRKNKVINWFDIGEIDYRSKVETRVSKWYTERNESK